MIKDPKMRAEYHRRYMAERELVFLMYRALYHYAFYESVRRPKRKKTQGEMDAARLRHNANANAWYHKRQAELRADAAAESVRVRLLWAPVWRALVGLIAAAYREERAWDSARKRRQKAAKPEHYLTYQRAYAANNRERLNARRREWASRTQYEARRASEDIANVSPRYVVKKLLDGTSLRAKDLPPALIEAKRQQLLLRRAIQQKTQ